MIQLPYNLAMPEAFTRANQRLDNKTVSVLEAAQRLGLYIMASASIYQGQLARNLPPVVGDFLPGLTTDAQRALQLLVQGQATRLPQALHDVSQGCHTLRVSVTARCRRALYLFCVAG